MSSQLKVIRLNARISEKEESMLHAVCDHYNNTLIENNHVSKPLKNSDIIRDLIHKEYIRLFGMEDYKTL